MSYEYPEYFLEVPDLDNVSLTLYIIVTKGMLTGGEEALWCNAQAVSTRPASPGSHPSSSYPGGALSPTE